MKHIINFNEWLSESTETAETVEWKDIVFDNNEKDVADIAEQELLTSELMLIDESNKVLFTKLTQLASNNTFEPVLEISGQLLEKFESPFEFIRWKKIGSEDTVLELQYIIKCIDEDKIS